MQFHSPRVEGANFGRVRTVLALCGPVGRHCGLVAPAAVAAVPTSEEGRHSAPTPLASDCSFDAIRLIRRESARPQSPTTAAVVAFPTKVGPLVVQWRSTVPLRRRAAAAHTSQVLTRSWSPSESNRCPQIAQCSRLNSVAMSRTPLSSPRPAGATQLSWGVGPSGRVGSHTLSHIGCGPPGLRRKEENEGEKEEAPFGASEAPARRRAGFRHQAVANSRVVTVTSYVSSLGVPTSTG